MSTPDSTASTDEPSPPERRGISYSWLIPIATVVIVVVAVIAGLLLQARHFDTDPEPPQELPPADQLYNSYCAMCHGEDGQGEGTRFPPLVDTDWVEGDKERLILINLHGLRGPIEVGDRTYDEVMPGFGRRLSNEELALILSHIRTSWGNEASEITADEVTEVRQQYPLPRQSWTVESLQQRQGQ